MSHIAEIRITDINDGAWLEQVDSALRNNQTYIIAISNTIGNDEIIKERIRSLKFGPERFYDTGSGYCTIWKKYQLSDNPYPQIHDDRRKLTFNDEDRKLIYVIKYSVSSNFLRSYQQVSYSETFSKSGAAAIVCAMITVALVFNCLSK